MIFNLNFQFKIS